MNILCVLALCTYVSLGSKVHQCDVNRKAMTARSLGHSSLGFCSRPRPWNLTETWKYLQSISLFQTLKVVLQLIRGFRHETVSKDWLIDDAVVIPCRQMAVAYVSATTCALVTALSFKSLMSTVRLFVDMICWLLFCCSVLCTSCHYSVVTFNDIYTVSVQDYIVRRTDSIPEWQQPWSTYY